MPTLDKVALDIQVVLGTTTMPVHQVLRLGRGAIIELDASEDDEVAILANNFRSPRAPWSSAETASRSKSRSWSRDSPTCVEPASPDWPNSGQEGRGPCSEGADLLHRCEAGQRRSRSPHMRSWRNW